MRRRQKIGTKMVILILKKCAAGNFFLQNQCFSYEKCLKIFNFFIIKNAFKT